MKEISGMMIYYYVVCKRKLWYFDKRISMEQENENVQIGKLLDEESYQRDEKHININNVINIDFIKSKGILHEIKKSKKIEEASILQVKYYLYYLKKYGVDNIKAKLDYPLLKETLDIELKLEDEIEIEKICENIQVIISLSKPPEKENLKICKSCAYYDLCYI
jgi:CRISPR-associated exonuclease Cas4